MFKFNLQEQTPSKLAVISLAHKLMTVDQSKFYAFNPNSVYTRSFNDFLTPARLLIAEYHSFNTLQLTLNKKTNTAIFLA